jgi:hypothetical protein
VGYRFGRHLPSALPLIVTHCEKAGEGDEELRENCLQVRPSCVEMDSVSMLSDWFSLILLRVQLLHIESCELVESELPGQGFTFRPAYVHSFKL